MSAYDGCRTLADVERVLAMQPRRGDVTWAEAVACAGKPSPLDEHPGLAGLAEAKNRTTDAQLLAAVARLTGKQP